MIESKADNRSLREFMMASMAQSMNVLRQIPVGILIEPLVKQCSLTGYNEDDLNLLTITSSHPRLGVKHALQILDLVGKVVLNDPVYCRMCWNPMFSLLRRFPRQLQLQSFMLRFVKVALKQLLQNELRNSAAGGGNFNNKGNVHLPQQREQPLPLDIESENLLLQLFDQVDVNKTKSISKNNLLQYMQRAYTPLHEASDRFPKLQPLLKPSTYAITLQNMSTSDTGFVTFDEFKNFAASLSRTTINDVRNSGQPQSSNADFTSDYDAELSSIQGKRVMIMSVLGRLVNLRNSEVNNSILPIFKAAKRNLMELYLVSFYYSFSSFFYFYFYFLTPHFIPLLFSEFTKFTRNR